MLRQTTRRCLKINPTEAAGASKVAAAPKRRRNFVFKSHSDPYTRQQEEQAAAAAKASSSASASASGPAAAAVSRGFIPPARTERGVAARALRPGEPSGAFSPADAPQPDSQRARHRQKVAREEALRGEAAAVPGARLTPLPSSYGFYDGIDADGYRETRPSREERRRLMQRALEERAASVLEVTDGGEDDIDLGGLPASEYHGQAGWTAIPRDSALFSSVLGRGEIESRLRANSWTLSAHRTRAEAAAEPVVAGEHTAAQRRQREAEAAAGAGETLSASRRLLYDDPAVDAAGELMTPVMDSIGAPRSTYGMRKLFMSGLVGYQAVVSPQEEVQLCEELLHLLQDPRAAYVAEETRYCVNLYEHELGIPGKDTLAFGMDRAPTLQRVLYRFFYLGFIPAPPNVCQISEMIGTFSGYPVHRKPPSIGPYFGMLSLVSPSVVHMRHRDSPWYPRLHAAPRSLFVFEEPCLSEYAVGYQRTHQPFHAFDYATRVSKDYRIEVLFACVETEHSRQLREAVQLTAYAKAKQGEREAAAAAMITDGKGNAREATPSGDAETSARGGETTDMWLQRMREKIHAAGPARPAVAPPDGNKLRDELIQQGRVGPRSQSLGASRGAAEDGERRPEGATAHTGGSEAARRRVQALKARYELAQRLKVRQGQQPPAQRTSDGPTLIRGYSPADKKRN